LGKVGAGWRFSWWNSSKMVASPWLKSKPPTGKINKKSPGFNHTIREPNLEVDES
jgi:hypothetical protein